MNFANLAYQPYSNLQFASLTGLLPSTPNPLSYLNPNYTQNSQAYLQTLYSQTLTQPSLESFQYDPIKKLKTTPTYSNFHPHDLLLTQDMLSGRSYDEQFAMYYQNLAQIGGLVQKCTEMNGLTGYELQGNALAQAYMKQSEVEAMAPYSTKPSTRQSVGVKKAIVLQDNRQEESSSKGIGLLRKRTNPVFVQEGVKEVKETEAAMPILDEEKGLLTKKTISEDLVSRNSGETKPGSPSEHEKEIAEEVAEVEKKIQVIKIMEEETNIVKTPVGEDKQVKVSKTMEKGDLMRAKNIKMTWDPTCMPRQTITKGFKKISTAAGETEINEEKSIKLLNKFDLNLNNVVEDIKKNGAFYKNFFNIGQRQLRSRRGDGKQKFSLLE